MLLSLSAVRFVNASAGDDEDDDDDDDENS
jgi:hypothetical protein